MTRKMLMTQRFRFVDKDGNEVRRFKTSNDEAAIRIATRENHKGDVQRIIKTSDGGETYTTIATL